MLINNFKHGYVQHLYTRGVVNPKRIRKVNTKSELRTYDPDEMAEELSYGNLEARLIVQAKTHYNIK